MSLESLNVSLLQQAGLTFVPESSPVAPGSPTVRRPKSTDLKPANPHYWWNLSCDVYPSPIHTRSKSIEKVGDWRELYQGLAFSLLRNLTYLTVEQVEVSVRKSCGGARQIGWDCKPFSCCLQRAGDDIPKITSCMKKSLEVSVAKFCSMQLETTVTWAGDENVLQQRHLGEFNPQEIIIP